MAKPIDTALTTKVERLSVLLGGAIRLCLVGSGHPPVAVEVSRAAAKKGGTT